MERYDRVTYCACADADMNATVPAMATIESNLALRHVICDLQISTLEQQSFFGVASGIRNSLIVAREVV
jgi:hypothetical protein